MSKRPEAEAAIQWWVDRIKPRLEDGMSLLALARRRKFDKTDAQVEAIEETLREAFLQMQAQAGHWNPRHPYWGSYLRRFGTDPKLPYFGGAALRVLRHHDLTIDEVGWPKGAVMQVNPGRVHVKVDGEVTEIVYPEDEQLGG